MCIRDRSTTAKIVYMCITYFIWEFFYTIGAVSYTHLVTPEDSFCISPRLLYTLSSCWDTVWNEAFSRVFKVPVSFSSTV